MSENFTTGDAYAAALILAHKAAKFLGTSVNARGKVYFSFAPSDRIQSLLFEFATDGTQVNSKDFATAHKHFVDQIRRRIGGSR
jgi:hypothetical protein